MFKRLKVSLILFFLSKKIGKDQSSMNVLMDYILKEDTYAVLTNYELLMFLKNNKTKISGIEVKFIGTLYNQFYRLERVVEGKKQQFNVFKDGHFNFILEKRRDDYFD